MPKLYSSSTYVTTSSTNSPFAAVGGSSVFVGDGLMSFEEAAAVASRVTSNLHTDGQTDDSSTAPIGDGEVGPTATLAVQDATESLSRESYDAYNSDVNQQVVVGNPSRLPFLAQDQRRGGGGHEFIPRFGGIGRSSQLPVIESETQSSTNMSKVRNVGSIVQPIVVTAVLVSLLFILYPIIVEHVVPFLLQTCKSFISLLKAPQVVQSSRQVLTDSPQSATGVVEQITSQTDPFKATVTAEPEGSTNAPSSVSLMNTIAPSAITETVSNVDAYTTTGISFFVIAAARMVGIRQ